MDVNKQRRWPDFIGRATQSSARWTLRLWWQLANV
jgi:hypothetical protein